MRALTGRAGVGAWDSAFTGSGAAEGALTNLDTPEEAQEQIAKAVRELLANFPPGLKR